MKKPKLQKTLTTDEYIDGKLDLVNSQKSYDDRTEEIKDKDHLRVITIRIPKSLTYAHIPNTIPASELIKPHAELIKEAGGIEKCKWVLHPSHKEKYETIIKKIAQEHAKAQGVTLIDYLFYDTIYDEKQYYEGFARGTDELTSLEVGLTPLKMTESKKKYLIKKVVTKIDKEWHLKKI